MTQRRTIIEATPAEPDFVEAFRPVLQQAIRRSRDLGRPVLASRTATLPIDAEPVPLIGLSPYFFWEQPEREFSLLAVGEVARIESEGAHRFSTVRERLQALTGDAVVESTAPLAGSALPLCLSGFSFDPGRRAGMPRVSTRGFADPVDEWRVFPAALAIVPQLLYMRRRGEHFLTMNAVVDDHADVDAILDRTRAVLAGARADRGAGAAREQPLQATDAPDDFPSWRASVSSLTSAIAKGEAEKVVLARRVELRCESGFDIPAALERLRSRYPNCTVFAVRDGDDCVLGATPEMLVSLEDGRVRGDCLAGSARRGANEAEDEAIGRALLADDKERREHAMVVRGLVESLRQVCVAIDAPQTPSLRKMANVQHLHTPIEARMPGERHVLELVERLHPTPAVGGLPKSRALCLINDNERFDRGWYAGPIGWIDAKGGGEFAVALRSALVQGRRAFLYAGCGIVSGSDPKREYEESRIKLEAMRWALSEQT